MHWKEDFLTSSYFHIALGIYFYTSAFIFVLSMSWDNFSSSEGEILKGWQMNCFSESTHKFSCYVNLLVVNISGRFL